MNVSRAFRSAALAGVATCVFIAQPSSAQDSETSADQSSKASEGSGSSDNAGTIIVEGQRLRGQLDVEQAPILELGEEEIAAEGVASIADLVTQISAQTGSSRGRGGSGRPIILVNGIRPGSFRELFQYPPEALNRVEVFPEEVAQRFGFSPDRRVINLILKDNYRNAEVEFEFEGPSRGGNYTREQELGFLQITNGARANVNLEANDTSLLTEDERDILQTPGSISDIAGDPGQAPFRSLISDSRALEANVSWAKAFLDSGTAVSANVFYERRDARALQGLNTVLLTDAAGNSALRTFGEETPIEQTVAIDTFSASGSVNTPVNAFRLTSTFDASLSESETRFDQLFDASDLVASALTGDLAIDAALPSSIQTGFDVANRRTITAETLTTLRGPLAYLPGGELNATFDIGGNWQRIESADTRTQIDVGLTRRVATIGTNLNIPITSRREGFADALGSFTLNLNLRASDLSDFGTLGSYTAGLTWAPFGNLDLSATYIEREVAPSLNALGDPQIVNFNIPVFDFVNGETVLADVTTGGNPDLIAETQRDWKFAANWELPFWQGARFQVEYIRNRSDDVVSAFPQITQEIEAAFPDRITRDAGGTLIALDRRQVTFAETRADRLNFSLNLRGTIGGGQRGGPPGARGGRPGGGGGPPPGAGRGRLSGGPPAAAAASQREGRRAAFMQFRERICAADGLEVLTRLANAIARGEDVSAIIPGGGSPRLMRMVERMKGEDGQIDPERLAAMRNRICNMDPSAMRDGPQAGPPGAAPGDRPSGAPGGPPAGAMGEGFAAFRMLVCAEDGEAKLRALVARIDRGEDISDTIPGFDPNMAGFMIDRLRGEDGELSSERIAGIRARFCNADGEGTAQGRPGGGASRGGPPGRGFNPLARRNFSGFRYFVSLNHTIELDNEILIAPGLTPLDQLDGESTNAFGLPRHTARLEAGIFGQGVGMRLSGRYTGSTRLDGSGLPGSTAIFFNDLATFDLRLFANIDELTGSESPILKNVRVSLRADNIFDGQLRVVDESGDTPINFQPFLIDPVGRFIGIDIRKLF
ncbi:hypothetical protein [uncultured Erythrobacter sp.]|uniref:hypothetical protein n=1 Tax=uncultured Erythrobacter sp. TaxID=263913 RepID=UPI00262E78B7|nr:hypothetical protein [uncultured Erythrobacter sp.]